MVRSILSRALNLSPPPASPQVHVNRHILWNILNLLELLKMDDLMLRLTSVPSFSSFPSFITMTSILDWMCPTICTTKRFPESLLNGTVARWLWLLIQWFYITKSVFLAVNASLRWLNNVSSWCVLPCLVSRVWDISSDVGPCFSLCKFYTNARGKRPIQRHPLLGQY